MTAPTPLTPAEVDEIERRAKRMAEVWSEIPVRADEFLQLIATLRAAEAERDRHGNKADELCVALVERDDEIARLREALQKIAGMGAHGLLDRAVGVARAALSPAAGPIVARSDQLAR